MKLEAWTPDVYGQMTPHWRAGQQFVGRRNARAVLWMARRWLKGRVLDAGCGDGAMVHAVRKRGIATDVTGIDLAPPALGDGIIAGDITQMPFESTTFDCALMMDLLEHLPVDGVPKAMAELRRVLKPRGRLCITTPNDEDLKSALVMCPCCRKWFHPAGHTQSFTRETLRELLAGNGFEDIAIRSYGLDAYWHFGAAGGLVSAVGRVVFPRMRWDEWLFAEARPTAAG